MRHLLEREAHAAGRRIAVVGAGVAGLAAAWLLSKQHHVTLYEKNPWLGGHANTVEVDCPEGPVAVDTGFIVYNPGNYPNFTALLYHLGVAGHDSDMSLGVSVGDGRLEYSSRPHGLFGQLTNLVNPRFWGMVGDVLKFYRQARELDETDVHGVSLGDFLARERYSAALVDEHVLPMCAAIWSTTPAEIRDYPMRSFLRFFRSHGLLQVTDRVQWRTVSGGSRKYVAAIRRDMPRVAVRPAARRITRHGGLSIVDLTTVNYPGQEMGEVAAATLLNKLNKSNTANLNTIVLRHELIIRQSSLKR